MSLMRADALLGLMRLMGMMCLMCLITGANDVFKRLFGALIFLSVLWWIVEIKLMFL